ncbi:MBL fold metallo-hydrolase [Reichenbachiella sp. MALMAid0571]|uniref:MBL fold metallo-hydrolase n=1 Tax=Reichenbachiella sp. MALMAid0571 TaxID=3143939 RepID=UPI0032DEAF57
MKNLIKAIALMAFLMLSVVVPEVQAQQDKIPANDGEVTIIPINHATLALKWKNEVIYFDPSGDMGLFDKVEKPTAILITDIHGDHFNLSTLNNLSAGSVKIIAPKAVADQLPRSFTNVKILGNSEKIDINGINIEAIPMYNLPETEDSRHPKGRGNGYVLTIGGKTIYVSGDTEDIQEMRALQNIDVAFVCMNLPYTMDVDAAASAVVEFKPSIVYPYHFRGQGGFSDVDKFKELVTSQNNSIDVRLRKWYGK